MGDSITPNAAAGVCAECDALVARGKGAECGGCGETFCLSHVTAAGVCRGCDDADDLDDEYDDEDDELSAADGVDDEPDEYDDEDPYEGWEDGTA